MANPATTFTTRTLIQSIACLHIPSPMFHQKGMLVLVFLLVFYAFLFFSSISFCHKSYSCSSPSLAPLSFIFFCYGLAQSFPTTQSLSFLCSYSFLFWSCSSLFFSLLFTIYLLFTLSVAQFCDHIYITYSTIT